MAVDKIEFEQKFNQGREAFDRGQYRQSVLCFEAAIQCTKLATKQGGEAQLWLAMAHQAAGDLASAKQICRKLIRHPHADCRKQGQQVLEILQAPTLVRPAEWLTPIPDLSRQENLQPTLGKMRRRSRPSSPPLPPIQFEDTRRMNTKDNGFIFGTIGFLLLLLGASYWLS